MSEYQIKNRIWLEKNGKTFLAPGKVSLLKKIDAMGSIRLAANDMNMSYKKAWFTVNKLNQESPRTLVIKNSGGNGGGGTILTEYAKQLLIQFDNIENQCFNFTNSLSAGLNF